LPAAQRFGEDENPKRNELLNGPLRVGSKVCASVFTVACPLSIPERAAHVSCRGYVGILLSGRASVLQIKVAPPIISMIIGP
jgi:hypothetical protein